MELFHTDTHYSRCSRWTRSPMLRSACA